MAVAYVQSAHNAVKLASSAAKAFTSNNTAGNLLVCCVGVWKGASFSEPTISDTLGNTWKLLLSSPSQFFSGGGSRTYLFAAYNCAAGANTVTVTVGSSSDIDMAIHEYSGVATITPLDQIAANSRPTSGTILAGTIQTRFANEVLFSFVYDQSTAAETYTPTTGWNGREQTSNPDGACLKSFDQLVSSTGSYTNTITCSAGAGSRGLHAMIVSFADTSISDPLVQVAKNSATGSSLTVAFPSANAAGNLLLLAIGRVSSTIGTISSVTDSQGNTWALVGSSTVQTNSGQSQSHLYACALCAAGANTITVTTSVSQDLNLIAAEYTPSVINTDIANTNHGSTSIASGNLAVDAGLAFTLGYNQNYTGGMNSDVSGTGWRNRANNGATGPFSDDNGTTTLSIFDQIISSTSTIEQTLSISVGSSGLHVLVAGKAQSIRSIMEFLIT